MIGDDHLMEHIDILESRIDKYRDKIISLEYTCAAQKIAIRSFKKNIESAIILLGGTQ